MEQPEILEKKVRRIWARALAICPDLMTPKDAKVRDDAIAEAAGQMLKEGEIKREEIESYLAAVRKLLITEKFTKDFGMTREQAGRVIGFAPWSPGARFDRHN
jgi:hypothetical protein